MLRILTKVKHTKRIRLIKHNSCKTEGQGYESVSAIFINVTKVRRNTSVKYLLRINCWEKMLQQRMQVSTQYEPSLTTSRLTRLNIPSALGKNGQVLDLYSGEDVFQEYAVRWKTYNQLQCQVMSWILTSPTLWDPNHVIRISTSQCPKEIDS